MTQKVVIDTNVIISALLFGGKPGELIALWENNRIEPIISREIIDEYIRVLAYPKFELTEKEIQYLVYQQLLPYFQVVKTQPGQVIVQTDPSDDKFIRCALAGNSKIIVSGDIHLLSLTVYQDIHIVSTSQFMDMAYELKPSRKKHGKTSLTDQLFGIFKQHAETKPVITKKDIEEVTEKHFTKGWSK